MNTEITENPTGTSKEKSRIKTMAFYAREALALAIWFSILIKIFVYDIDLLIVNRFSILQRLYPYKFFLIIGVTAAVWLFFGTKRTWKTIGYIAVYPFGPLPWRIIKLIVKNWAVLFVFLPAIENVVLTMKWRFILASFTALAALTMCLSHKSAVVIFGMSVLFFYLAYHYILRLRWLSERRRSLPTLLQELK
jgi:hypothetical protein